MLFPDDRFRRILESQFALYMICDNSGRIEYISPEGRDFFEIAGGSVKGKAIFEIIPEENVKEIWKISEESFKSGELIKKELPIMQSGETNWFEVISSPVSDPEDGKQYVLISARDVTVCRIAEEKARESELKINKILGGCPVPIFVLNTDHKIIYWNQALENYSGLKAADMIGTDLHWKAFYRRKRPCMVDLLLEKLYDEIKVWYEGKYWRSDLIEGAYGAEDYFPGLGIDGKWLHFTASVVRDQTGKVIGGIETLEDITTQKDAEFDLIMSKNKYHSYVEKSPVGIFITDIEGNYVEVNPAACKLLGYTRDEYLRMNVTQVVPPSDVEKIIEDFKSLIEEKEFNKEIRLQKKNGEICNVILRAVNLPDENYMGFTTDITELKKTGEALIEKERIFRLLFETMLEGVAIHDMVYEDGEAVDYRITDVNYSFESILGIPAEEAIGKLGSELFSSEGSAPYLEVYNRVAASGKPESFEIYFSPLDKYFEISVFSPRQYSFATIFSDITERKKFEIALIESEEKFREVFNNANDIILLIEVEDGRLERIIEINTMGTLVLGYSKNEFLQMDPILLIDESDREKVIEITTKINEIPEISFEILLRTKGGKKIPVETKSRVFTLGGKQLSLSVLRDITERINSRDIEKRAFFQIEENIRQLATLGDTIRNPLAVIVGLADLYGGDIGEKIKSEASVINDYITMLDRGWIESEKVRDFLKRHYGIE